MTARGKQLEFGDFQTPDELAREVLAAIHQDGFQPRSLLEPTCGRGSFIKAGLDQFPSLQAVVGVDINSIYLNELRQNAGDARVRLIEADCFAVDWRELALSLPQPILIAGNPPWVTSSRLGVLGSGNSPIRDSGAVKSGLEALTGKSNFDVSEWLLRRWIQAMDSLDARLIMLVKSSVARRLMLDLPSTLGATQRPIPAKQYFGADVSACVFDVHRGGPRILRHNGMLVADADLFRKHASLGAAQPGAWRSGVKHDAAKVFELEPCGPGHYRN